MQIERKYLKSMLHRAHFYADLAISAMALVSLFFADALETFFKVDLVFHIAIALIAIVGIALERVLHKDKHDGMIAEK